MLQQVIGTTCDFKMRALDYIEYHKGGFFQSIRFHAYKFCVEGKYLYSEHEI